MIVIPTKRAYSRFWVWQKDEAPALDMLGLAAILPRFVTASGIIACGAVP